MKGRLRKLENFVGCEDAMDSVFASKLRNLTRKLKGNIMKDKYITEAVTMIRAFTNFEIMILNYEVGTKESFGIDFNTDHKIYVRLVISNPNSKVKDQLGCVIAFKDEASMADPEDLRYWALQIHGALTRQSREANSFWYQWKRYWSSLF